MKTATRKIRSDNRLARLPKEAQDEILSTADGGASLAELRGLIARRWSLPVSASALSVWLRAARARRRLEQSVDVAEMIAKQARAANAGAEIDEALTAMIKQLALDAAIAAEDPQQIKMLFDVVLKKQKTDLDARRISLAEARAKQADAAERVAKNVKMTPEERDAALRRIFRVA